MCPLIIKRHDTALQVHYYPPISSVQLKDSALSTNVDNHAKFERPCTAVRPGSTQKQKTDSDNVLQCKVQCLPAPLLPMRLFKDHQGLL
jgi:hypothetical protein